MPGKRTVVEPSSNTDPNFPPIGAHFFPIKTELPFFSLHEEGGQQSQLFLKLHRPSMEDKPLVQVEGSLQKFNSFYLTLYLGSISVGPAMST